MAAIELRGLAHSYLPNPATQADWALSALDLRWRDGGAYALLGPSGCGKTTLLNIVSGLLRPSRGGVFFDGREVTGLDPRARNIAQVFQFPVVYDTMTVYENLAFPLSNRGAGRTEIESRVQTVASALGLDAFLHQRAKGLTADAKQKISLGRGLVRTDVAAILFDEPLTVIDPHLKWRLRGELKALHQKHGFTMIYVTHDQTEALTFADEVVVMNEGRVVQVGTPAELFDRPQHIFVGHFIGSPGMNVLPANRGSDGELRVGGAPVPLTGAPAAWPPRTLRVSTAQPQHAAVPLSLGEALGDAQAAGPSAPGCAASLQLGVRPEHVRFARDGWPVKLERVVDAGPVRILDLHFGALGLKMVIGEAAVLPAPGDLRIAFDSGFTHLYANGWLVS